MVAAGDPNAGNLPHFNQKDEDKMALGHTPSTRSAELVAGARAILLDTKETVALSSMAGRIIARVLTDTGGKINVLWFFPARMMAIEALTERLVPSDKPDLLLVDVAAGFSPRGLHMARRYPQAQVIEVDLPDMVAEKKQRLSRGKIEIPSNLSWIEADLGKTTLGEVLEGRQADFITSEGLTLYLSPEENQRFFQQMQASLKPGGVFMFEAYFKDKFQTLRQSPNINTVASFVLRMVGNVPGIMPDMNTARQYLSDAGFAHSVEYPVTDMMDELHHPKPVDIISIVVSRKPVAFEPPHHVEAQRVTREHQAVPDAVTSDTAIRMDGAVEVHPPGKADGEVAPPAQNKPAAASGSPAQPAAGVESQP